MCYTFSHCYPFYSIFLNLDSLMRSSRPEVFYKKGVLRNFAKYTGKQLCQSLFFNKVADLSLATLLKKRLWHRCFPDNFAKFRRTFFLAEHLRWLLLYLINFWYAEVYSEPCQTSKIAIFAKMFDRALNTSRI